MKSQVEHKVENEDKVPSYVITYNMYKEGKSIEDIIIGETIKKSYSTRSYIKMCL